MDFTRRRVHHAGGAVVGVPVEMYSTLRTLHLLFGALSLPYLLMYGLSAVQMAHSKWFPMKPAVVERDVPIGRPYDDGRRLAQDLMLREGLRGEIQEVTATQAGFNVRVVVPGTVNEVRYDRGRGSAHIKTSVAGFMGMLNRLHHAAGLWHEYVPLRLWAAVVGIVSLAILGLGTTGLWMWWLRRQERMLGLVLLTANVVFTIVVFSMIRSAGP